MNTDENNAYHEVGYGKPPAHARFAKGRSGNPRRRPKNSVSMRRMTRNLLEQTVPINDGGINRAVPKYELVLRLLMNKALQGDHKAALTILKVGHILGIEPAAETRSGVTFIIEG
jgi:hypothetical protein